MTNNLILIAIISIFLTGCVSSTPEEMTTEYIEVTNSIEGTPRVAVVGSNERLITNEAIKLAVEKSISNAGLFTDNERVIRINLSVLAIENPLFGGSLTSEIRIRWQLYDEAEEVSLFESVVASEYTATIGDAFVGAQRMKMANDGAIRENIKIALEKISREVK